jgi:ammonia channel protein AmtB
MRTLGFYRPAIASLVLSENAALLVAGLLSGCLAALVAIAPAIAADPMAVPWRSIAITLLARIIHTAPIEGGRGWAGDGHDALCTSWA